MKVVIIGGVAAGPKAASKIIRMKPDTEVTIIEKGVFLSYAGCGLPYYVSGEIKEQKELMETPAGVLRDAAFFLNVKNFCTALDLEVFHIQEEGGISHNSCRSFHQLLLLLYFPGYIIGKTASGV